MTTVPRKGPSRGLDAAPQRRRVLPAVLLLAGFVLALFPGFHWALGSAAGTMVYVIGTAAFITAVIVAIYVLDRPAHGAGTSITGEEAK